MKIKNILHAAALRFCLVAMALGMAVAVFAAPHKASSGTNQTLDITKLSAITTLSISGDDEFYDNSNNTTSEISKNTYYDTDTWFHEGGERKVSEDTYNDNKKHVVWKNDHYLVFKVNSGLYSLKVCFRPKQGGRGMRVFSGTSKDSPNNHIDLSEDAWAYMEKEFYVHVTEAYEYLWLTGTSGDVALYTVELKEVQPLSPNFPSDLNAITSDKFWYHNDGGGLYSHGTSDQFYRYIGAYIGAPYAVTSTNPVTINNTAYKSYELKPDDAIGFKLNTNSPYRVKVYYYVDPNNKSDYADAELHAGTQANNTLKYTDATEETIIKTSTGGDTGTRLRTYDISNSSNDIFWIKNDNRNGKSLYIGGYEILPSNQSVTIPDQTFTGTWYVTGEAGKLTNINNSNGDYGSIAKSHGNVVLWGPTMAINNYELAGNKTVMLNNGSRIGVNIPAGSTLSFQYTADGTTKRLKLIDTNGNDISLVSFDKEEDAVGNYNYYAFPYGKISYTNNTGAAQKVWITGESASYAYIGALKIPSTGPSIENAVAISEDYVWYPIDRTYLFGSNVYTDEHQNVYIYTDFQIKGGTTTNEMIKPEKHALRGNKDAYYYRTDKYTQLGFKIAQGKKGVINFYYIEDDTRRVKLYKSSNPAALGDAIGDTHTVNKDGTNNVIATQYHFDTTGGEETFWLRSDGLAVWFGGFEVLFEDTNNGGQNLSKDVPYTVSTSATVTNALGTDTHPIFKSVSANPVGGASMLMYQPGTNDAVAVGGNTNGVIVKVPSDCKYLNINGYLDGDASFKIYRGSATAPDKSASVTLGGSGNIDKNVSLDDLSSISGDVYWITSDDVAGAYVTSVTPKDGTFSELQPTDVNYIYYVDGVPTSTNNGVQNSGDCNGRILFVDGGETAKIASGAKMNVIGTDVNPVTINNGEDYFGIKVDKGPGGVETGYVKVYFNGGNAGNHKMEELPLSDPMYSGWNSTYDPATQTITFNNGGGRGWWFGNAGSGARDLVTKDKYNKINIEIESVDYDGKEEDAEGKNAPKLQAIIQSTGGGAVFIDMDENGRITGDIPQESYSYKVTRDDGTEETVTFDPTSISQIYIGSNKAATVKIKSARLMNKPIVVAKGSDESGYNSETDTELFGGKIYNIDGGYVYEYPFDLSKATSVPQLTWITGAGSGSINIAAIEVLYDSKHAKVVDWYVNKDTKMIVGSDDPYFTMKDFDGKDLTYPPGYDEYVTFYMSSGRQANVSFIMPEAVREAYDWQEVLKSKKLADITFNDGKNESNYKDYVEDDNALKATYGKHTINPGNPAGEYNLKKIVMQSGGTTYNRHCGTKVDKKKFDETGEITGIGNDLYSWYTYTYNLPASNSKGPQYTDDNFWAATVITATQVKDGKEYKSDSDIETVDDKLGQWKIYMRFVSYKAPVADNISNNVTVKEGQDKNTYPIYYTIDSSDPENYGVLTDTEKVRTSTELYNADVSVKDKNCIFKAAQYINTPYAFYDDITKGKEKSLRSNVLKLVSKDLPVTNEINSVVYVKNTSLIDEQIFNVQKGGYMLTIPTGTRGWKSKDPYTDKSGKEKTEEDGDKNKIKVHYYDQEYNANPLMYLTLGGKDHPYLNGDVFNMCGTNWMAGNDSGLKTYLDSYQNKMDVDGVKNPEWWVSGDQNQNPYTECNMGPGGPDTEDGGMFLQPIGGAMLRFEPEFDGVITVWLRQNGCLDNNSQENGKFARRPVFVMDENGRIMRRSTIRPTAEHYMGINGTWAINSNVCEERSQVEHTWLYEVAKQAFADHPVYASRFGSDFPNRWETLGHDHSGHILYGWWYKGFDLDANRYRITSADHVSRFEYMEPQLLYRSDNIYKMEMNRLDLSNTFAKYGYELPNFQYVRYRIPVKAGKTYYIAGRGTKNGFSAIRFDALRPNTNIGGLSGLRYKDNPEVVENQKEGDDYLKVSFDWDNVSDGDPTNDLSGQEASNVYTAYEGLPTLTIDENQTNYYNADKIDTQVYAGDKKVGMDDLGNLVGRTMDVTLKRTFKAGHWHPIMLPFSLSETRVEQYFGYGTVILYLDPYNHTTHNRTDAETGKSWTSAVSQALDGTKLAFTLHRYQMLYANTPAFICPTFDWSGDNLNPEKDKQDGTTWEDKDNIIKKKKPATDKVKPVTGTKATEVTNITFKRVTLDGSNSSNFLSGNKNSHRGYIGYAISNDYEVVGAYDSNDESGDIYYVNNVTIDGKETAQLIHSTGGTKTMRGTRVWIRPRATAVNPAPILTVGSKGFSDFEEDSESAGISDIVADDYTIEGYDIEDDSVYDMLGRKVGQGSLDGLLKGVYIFQGRKVYVK